MAGRFDRTARLICVAGQAAQVNNTMPVSFPMGGISALIVGQTILPPAAFFGGSSGHAQVFVPSRSRLKAGCTVENFPSSSSPKRRYAEVGHALAGLPAGGASGHDQ